MVRTDSGEGQFAAVPDFIQRALEPLPVAIVTVDRDGAIIWNNPEAERLLGYSGAELVGHALESLAPSVAIDLTVQFAPLRNTPPSPIAGREVAVRRKDGSEIQVEMGLTAIPVQASQIILAWFVDLTPKRLAGSGLPFTADETLTLRTIITEIAIEFVNVHPDDIDRRIEDALSRVSRALDADRASVFRLEAPSDDFIRTHQWIRPGWGPPVPRLSVRETFPWHLAQLHIGNSVSYASINDVPNPADRENLRRLGTKSGMTVPIRIADRLEGILTVSTVRDERGWQPALVQLLGVLAQILGQAFAQLDAQEADSRALADARRVRDRLIDQNVYLRQRVKAHLGASALVGQSPAMRRVIERTRQFAAVETPVLITGEIGTGKTAVASRIHMIGPRRAAALIRVPCANLSPAAIADDLFDTEQSRYEGSEPRRTSAIALAQRSTLLLEEIADLSLETQTTLVTVLTERRLPRPQSSGAAADLDIRIIATTRGDLSRRVASGAFRQDLYELFSNKLPLTPLRERPEDIPPLAWRFVDEFSDEYGRPIEVIERASMEALERHAWPGNALELRNVIERAVLIGKGRQLQVQAPPPDPPPRAQRTRV
jgi:PAS domain S-box-containing protein